MWLLYSICIILINVGVLLFVCLFLIKLSIVCCLKQLFFAICCVLKYSYYITLGSRKNKFVNHRVSCKLLVYKAKGNSKFLNGMVGASWLSEDFK